MWLPVTGLCLKNVDSVFKDLNKNHLPPDMYKFSCADDKALGTDTTDLLCWLYRFADSMMITILSG